MTLTEYVILFNNLVEIAMGLWAGRIYMVFEIWSKRSIDTRPQ